MEDEDEDDGGLVIQARPKRGIQGSIGNVDLDVSSSNRGDVGLAEGNPHFTRSPRAPRGIMTKEMMAKIVLRYGVSLEFVCRLPGDSKCISYPVPIEVAVCKEMFRARFYLSLHPFILCLLDR